VRKTKCLGPVEAMTFREARKEAQRFLEAINDVAPGVEHAEKTVDQLIRQWRAAVKPNLKPSTQDGYEWAFARLLSKFSGCPVADVGKQDIQEFFTCSGRGLSGKSVRDLNAYVSGLFSVAEEWGWLAAGRHPVRGRFHLPENRPARSKVILSPGQFQSLLGVLEEPYRSVVAVAALSGLRKGELEALRWRHVGQGELTVDETVYRGRLGTPKTPNSRRRVQIGRFALSALEQWRKRAPFRGPDDFVFGIRTNSPIDLRNVAARHLKPACRRLGVPETSWHDLRHTYVTWGRRQGVAPEVMQRQLGHSSVQTTLGIYSHLAESGPSCGAIEVLALAPEGGKEGVNGTL
jgi:integrase